MPGLLVYKCPRSGGYWIPENRYWRWIAKQPERLEKLPATAGEDVVEEPTQAARMCLETGQLMTRYRVGEGFGFRIDRSPNGGIWLDKGEWEALESRNFHDKLLLVFTNVWQKEVVRAELLESFRRQFRQRVGEDGFNRVVEFKKWLKAQNDPASILAFLRDDEL